MQSCCYFILVCDWNVLDDGNRGVLIFLSEDVVVVFYKLIVMRSFYNEVCFLLSVIVKVSLLGLIICVEFNFFVVVLM